MRRSSWWFLLISAVTPLLLLWPLPRVFTSALLTRTDFEASTHIWGLWAAWRLHSPLVIDTTLLAWPGGVRFVLVDPANIVWMNLGLALGGVAGGYNLTLYMGFFLTGIAGGLLAKRAGGSPWLGALAAQACPTLLSAPARGMTEELGLCWVGLALAAWLWCSDRPDLRRTALAALAAAACAYSGPYNGVWIALLGLPVIALALAQRRWRAAAHLVGAGLAALALTAPLLTALAARQAEQSGGSGHAMVALEPYYPQFRGGIPFGADLLDVFLPLPLTGGLADAPSTAYIGIVALLAAAWGARRWRAGWLWIAASLAVAALSLGPRLHLAGEDLGLIGPAGLLMGALSGLGTLSRWSRLGAVAHLLLIPPISRLSGRLRFVAAAGLLLDVLLLSPLQWPLVTAAPPDPHVWAALPGPGAVLELPPRQSIAPSRLHWREVGLLSQVSHGRPISTSTMQLPLDPGGREALAAARLLLSGQGLPAERRAAMLGSGFRYLAVHTTHQPTGERGAAHLAHCLGAPLVEGEALLVYALAPSTGDCGSAPR
ncbi:MAG: hypothetical protein ACI8S6_002564 [Myxococcota bacterium]